MAWVSDSSWNQGLSLLPPWLPQGGPLSRKKLKRAFQAPLFPSPRKLSQRRACVHCACPNQESWSKGECVCGVCKRWKSTLTPEERASKECKKPPSQGNATIYLPDSPPKLSPACPPACLSGEAAGRCSSSAGWTGGDSLAGYPTPVKIDRNRQDRG